MAPQVQGRAPPPQVADVEEKTTLFCSTRAGPGRSPDPALQKEKRRADARRSL